MSKEEIKCELRKILAIIVDSHVDPTNITDNMDILHDLNLNSLEITCGSLLIRNKFQINLCSSEMPAILTINSLTDTIMQLQDNKTC